MTIKKKNRKVAVGVSGGVDSSVALALLKERGYSPVSIFMSFWGDKNNCCGSEAERRARKVSDILSVPFYKIDVGERFKKEVVNYFLDSYQKGETPNPCVVCNKRIKFKVLFDEIKALGGSYIATGHYGVVKDGRIFLSEDKKKDQTYFLWKLKKRDLRRIIFPLGDYKKEEIRKIAKKRGLPTASVSDSQEVCFIENGLSDFLRERIKLIPGDIENMEGEKIGCHEGLPIYTIGQRKGIGLSGGPFYVFDKDEDRNVLTVTNNSEDLLRKKVCFSDENYFTDISYPLEVKAKIRYNAAPGKGVIKKKGIFEFSNPQKAITPGQSIVFYKKDMLLGGGVIER